MKKQYVFATLMVLFSIAGADAASVGDRRPPGKKPQIAMVKELREASDEVVCQETRTDQIPVQLTSFKEENGRLVPVTNTRIETRQTTRLMSLAFKDSKFFSLDGKQLEPMQIWQRIKTGTPLLISTDGHPIDRIHIKAAALETILVIPGTYGPSVHGGITPGISNNRPR